MHSLVEGGSSPRICQVVLISSTVEMTDGAGVFVCFVYLFACFSVFLLFCLFVSVFMFLLFCFLVCLFGFVCLHIFSYACFMYISFLYMCLSSFFVVPNNVMALILYKNNNY